MTEVQKEMQIGFFSLKHPLYDNHISTRNEMIWENLGMPNYQPEKKD